MDPVIVFLMGRIYEVCLKMAPRVMMYLLTFMKTDSGTEEILRGFTASI
jgi:hypothetical protein